MKGKGLTIDMIVDTALKLIEEKGYDNFSVRDLAVRLNVRAASLYNHIDSVYDINRQVGKLAAERLNNAMSLAASGKKRDDALSAIAHAFHEFAVGSPELYRSIMGLPSLDTGDGLGQIGRDAFYPIMEVIHQFDISDEQAVHFARSFRSAMHGFSTQQAAGYYSNQKVSIDKSLDFLINGYIAWIHSLENKIHASDRKLDSVRIS